jgi:hypothetical protein
LRNRVGRSSSPGPMESAAILRSSINCTIARRYTHASDLNHPWRDPCRRRGIAYGIFDSFPSKGTRIGFENFPPKASAILKLRRLGFGKSYAIALPVAGAVSRWMRRANISNVAGSIQAMTGPRLQLADGRQGAAPLVHNQLANLTDGFVQKRHRQRDHGQIVDRAAPIGLKLAGGPALWKLYHQSHYAFAAICCKS